jgi:hypothetical protein
MPAHVSTQAASSDERPISGTAMDGDGLAGVRHPRQRPDERDRVAP